MEDFRTFYEQLINGYFTSSRSQMFFKIGVLKNVADFTEKIPVLKSLFNKVAGLKT